MTSLADVGPCADCQRPNCPTLLALIYGTGGSKFTWRDSDEAKLNCMTAQRDLERAKSARLEAEFAAASQRTGEAENRRDDWNRLYVEAIGQRDAERARADAEAANGAMLREAAQRLSAAFATYCKSRPGDEHHRVVIREFYETGYALDKVLTAAPSTALARVQGLVAVSMAARDVALDHADGDGGRRHRCDCDVCESLRALDAFTGATTSKAPCPRLLDASMLADGEAGDRVEEIRAHVGGCVECQRVIGDALQLAALADASR